MVRPDALGVTGDSDGSLIDGAGMAAGPGCPLELIEVHSRLLPRARTSPSERSVDGSLAQPLLGVFGEQIAQRDAATPSLGGEPLR
jgi:hypothetical protein